MTTISLDARSFWAGQGLSPLAQRNRKCLKLLSLLLASGLCLGCAGSQTTAFDRQLLLELEEKNVRLEAEVTRLREEKLRGDRKSACASEARTERAPRIEGPEALPVVQMSPEAPLQELTPGEVMIRPAEPLPEEAPIDDDTRPVLKVRGKHEAWVYHRAVTAEDRKAKTDPVIDSKALSDESK